jgi:hypothetical protein
MHDEHRAVVEIGEEELRPPPEARDPAPGEPPGEMRREGTRRSPRRCSTRSITAPSITGARPRLDGRLRYRPRAMRRER